MKTLAEMMGEWEANPNKNFLSPFFVTMQALKEAVEILKFHADPFLNNKDCQNWLWKYGFEEKE